MTTHPEIKNLTEQLINKYLRLINNDELKRLIRKIISDKYHEGLLSAELTFDQNYIPNNHTIEFLQRFAFDNVTKLGEDLKDSLRKEVSMGLMNRETTSVLRKRIRTTMDTTIERAKMIQVTESNRALNMGHFEGAKESGLKLVKRWDAQPERISRAGNSVPCKHCEFLDGQIVGLEEKFTDDKGMKFFLPPHHPNCACRVVYVQREDLQK